MRRAASATLLLLLPSATLSLSLGGAAGRRGFLQQLAAASAAAVGPAAARAAQKGAEDPYATQPFEQNGVCLRRTPLGACADYEAGGGGGAAQKPNRIMTAPPEVGMDSEVVQRLLQRTADNKEANDRLVLEKTIKAGLGGTYGPFAKEAPVMRTDGSFTAIPLARYDRLKNQNKIKVSTKTGLDYFVPGFDPDAPEPKQKFLGLF